MRHRDFEWSTVHGHWGLRPMGLPPKGVGYVTRLGAALSDAPFRWPTSTECVLPVDHRFLKLLWSAARPNWIESDLYK